jgi:hypothetical protein
LFFVTFFRDIALNPCVKMGGCAGFVVIPENVKPESGSKKRHLTQGHLDQRQNTASPAKRKSKSQLFE